MRLHLMPGFDDSERELLARGLDPSIEVTVGDAPAPGTEVLVCGHATGELLDAAGDSLRALIVPYTGPPRETVEAVAARPGISLHNLHHNAAATAEVAVALLYAAAKGLPRRHAQFKEHGWPSRLWADSDAILLSGRTALVAGYGAIGRRVAMACLGAGMEVLALRRRVDAPHTDDLGVRVHGLADLRELLPRANALIVCLPGTPETAGMFGAEELALLARPSIVVNVGRGPVIDEQALYEALRDGRVDAAGLDVWWTYPAGALDKDTGERGSRFPFHELDNIAMSPHRGGLSDLDAPMRMADLARLANAAARDEAIPNRIDCSTGY